MPRLHFRGPIASIVAGFFALPGMSAGCSGTDLGPAIGAGLNTGTLGGSIGGAVSMGGTTLGGSNATGGASGAIGGAGLTATGGATSVTVPTWTQLYNNYFGPGTSGNCLSCHVSGNTPTFNSASTLCSTLKSYGYIQTGSATLQDLLTWFGGSGNMPLVGGAVPANAVRDITAWQNAGAVCP